MNVAAGRITIDFTGRITEKDLLTKFDDFMIKQGIIKLVNVYNEEVILDIHEHEIIYLDQDDVESYESRHKISII